VGLLDLSVILVQSDNGLVTKAETCSCCFYNNIQVVFGLCTSFFLGACK
jgi:hypothetical protein